jgi:ribonuclease BN (tRNA processing enzyme)
MMQIVILGSGTGIPLADRASPALLLTSMNSLVLFDMGPGTLRQLARLGIPHERIGQILITHFHPDHTADLIQFLFVTRNPSVLARREPFGLAAPLGFRDFLEGLHRAYGKWIEIPGRIMNVDEMDTRKPDERIYPGFHLRSLPTPHTPHSLAYRITSPSSGKSLVYTGDTGFAPELADFARDYNLLITEASFPEGQAVEGHLTPSQAGRIAALARAHKLVLIHFYPEALCSDIVSQCRRTFDGELVLGRDFLHLTV